MTDPQTNPPAFSAEIRSLSHDGRGIAHINGKTVFIDDALPGETVLFTYTKRRQKFDEGQSITLLVPSPERVTPLCQHVKICGGCSLQHMHPDAQIRLKQQTLLDHLKHFGGITPLQLLPPLRGPHWAYRRKARLGVKYLTKKQTAIVGFREKNNRYLADLQGCEVLDPTIGPLLPALKTLLNELITHQHIAQIEVAVGDNTSALVFRHLQPLPGEDQAKLIAFANRHSIHIYLQPQGPETIKRLWPEQGPERLSYRLPQYDLELLFHPMDFTQINQAINEAMITRALDLLEPKASDQIVDLFCGLGNFTLPLAKHAAHVVGIEGNATAIQRAQENAHHNHITNVTFHCADLTTRLAHAPWASQHFDKILLDPPRSGAMEVIQQIPSLGSPRRIIYISCNPATLARDAGELVKNQGYTLSKVGIMDMFPHTAHVESIAVFEKSSR